MSLHTLNSVADRTQSCLITRFVYIFTDKVLFPIFILPVWFQDKFMTTRRSTSFNKVLLCIFISLTILAYGLHSIFRHFVFFYHNKTIARLRDHLLLLKLCLPYVCTSWVISMQQNFIAIFRIQFLNKTNKFA